MYGIFFLSGCTSFAPVKTKKYLLIYLIKVLLKFFMELIYSLFLWGYSSKRRKKNTLPLTLLDYEPMVTLNEGSKYLSEEDRIWLTQLDEILLQEIGNHKFDIEAVAMQLNMSRSSFFRKMQKVSDLSPKKYHNRFRFEYAKMVLETRKLHSVKAAASAIGMRDVECFSKMYKKQYGRSPSDCFP
jgi:AraC-like DNA-binding protein